MRFIRFFVFLAALALPVSSLSAQDLQAKAMDLLNRFNRPRANIDTTYFYQMKPRWYVSLSGTARQAGVEQVNNFSVLAYQPGPDGSQTPAKVPGTLSFGLNEKMYTGTGIRAGYGSVGVSFSVEVGRKSAQKNRILGYSYYGKGFGAEVQYFDFRQPLSYDMEIGTEGGWIYSREQSESRYPGELKVLLVDCFYALNRKSFSYQAAYRVGTVQRRTAGSWLLAGKYLQGETRINPDDLLAGWMGDLSRHRTGQASFGAGYSLNWVLFHRQPAEDESVLRNLTVNITALPMLTYYNHIAAYNEKILLSQSYGGVRINYMTRMGLCYIHGRFYANLIGDYDSFVMKGVSSIERPDGKYSDVHTEALFHKWTTTLCLNYKF